MVGKRVKRRTTLTTDQIKFMSKWKGKIHIVTCLTDCLTIFKENNMTTKLELQMKLVEAQRELKWLKMRIKAVSAVTDNLCLISSLNCNVEGTQKLNVVANLLLGINQE